MKVVRRKTLTTRAIVQQLFVERDILTFAENPFITSMACSFETDEHLAFVMDYVQGNDVSLRPYVWKVVLQLLPSIFALHSHSKNVTHANICHCLYVYSHGSFCPRRFNLWFRAWYLQPFSTGHGPIVYSRNSRGYRVPPQPWYCAQRHQTRKVNPQLVPLSQNLAHLLFFRFSFQTPHLLSPTLLGYCCYACQIAILAWHSLDPKHLKIYHFK